MKTNWHKGKRSTRALVYSLAQYSAFLPTMTELAILK